MSIQHSSISKLLATIAIITTTITAASIKQSSTTDSELTKLSYKLSEDFCHGERITEGLIYSMENKQRSRSRGNFGLSGNELAESAFELFEFCVTGFLEKNLIDENLKSVVDKTLGFDLALATNEQLLLAYQQVIKGLRGSANEKQGLFGKESAMPSSDVAQAVNSEDEFVSVDSEFRKECAKMMENYGKYRETLDPVTNWLSSADLSSLLSSNERHSSHVTKVSRKVKDSRMAEMLAYSNYALFCDYIAHPYQ